MSALDNSLITNLLCPLLGMILANLMWFSPWSVVMQVRHSRNLGALNPIPFVATVLNCIAWVIYGCLKKDPWMFWANAPGIVVGLFYCINVLTVMAKRNEYEEFTRLYLVTESFLLITAGFWTVMGIVIATAFQSLGSQGPAMAKLVVGLLACSFSIAYYAAPLSSLAAVIATQDASSLYFPTVLINTVNALMWFVYGAFGTKDITLWLPNGLGIALAAVQTILIFLFRKQSLWNTMIGRRARQIESVKSVQETDEEASIKNGKPVEKYRVRATTF